MSCWGTGAGGSGGRNITAGLTFVLVHKRKCNVSAELFGLSVKRFLFLLWAWDWEQISTALLPGWKLSECWQCDLGEITQSLFFKSFICKMGMIILFTSQGCCPKDVFDAVIKWVRELTEVALNSAKHMHCTIPSIPLIHFTPINTSKLSSNITYSNTFSTQQPWPSKERDIGFSSVSLQHLVHGSIIRLILWAACLYNLTSLYETDNSLKAVKWYLSWYFQSPGQSLMYRRYSTVVWN